jgi:malate dehydrogenase (oxaloacetate-decarboxylating)
MKIAAAYAIAGTIDDSEINPDYIIPKAFDLRIAPRVASAVAKAAIDSGVARAKDVTPEWVAEHTKKLLAEKDK